MLGVYIYVYACVCVCVRACVCVIVYALAKLKKLQHRVLLVCFSSPNSICMHAVSRSGHQQKLLQDINEHVILKVAAEWTSLAIQLGVGNDKINIIQKNYSSDCEEACRELFLHWIDEKKGTGCEPRTWGSVVRAIRKMGLEGLADELREVANYNEESMYALMLC